MKSTRKPKSGLEQNMMKLVSKAHFILALLIDNSFYRYELLRLVEQPQT